MAPFTNVSTDWSINREKVVKESAMCFGSLWNCNSLHSTYTDLPVYTFYNYITFYIYYIVQVTAKNVGGVFLRHTVHPCLHTLLLHQ